MPRFFRRHKTLTIACSLALLIIMGWLLPVTIADLWEWGAQVSGHPLAMLGIVLLMATLMSFGLAGSLCFWVIAPFHPPWLSVCMLLAGSLAGAVGAYRLGRGLGNNWRAGKVSRQVLRLLARRSDVLTQCALRIMPGVPHALVNLAAGVLRLPLLAFISAAAVGLSIKWTAYSHAVHGMVSASRAEEALALDAVAPLLVVGVLLVLGGASQRVWMRRLERTDQADHDEGDKDAS